MVAAIAAVAFSCKKKGIIKCIMGVISTALAIVLTCVFREPVMKVLEGTKLYESLYKSVSEKITGTVIAGDKGLISALVGDAIEKGVESAAESLISSLLSVILSVLLFIAIILILRLLTNLFSSAGKLPGLNFVNSVCGLAWGTVLGLAAFYVIFAVWAYIAAYELPQILDSTYIARSMYENNLLFLIFS